MRQGSYRQSVEQASQRGRFSSRALPSFCCKLFLNGAVLYKHTEAKTQSEKLGGRKRREGRDRVRGNSEVSLSAGVQDRGRMRVTEGLRGESPGAEGLARGSLRSHPRSYASCSHRTPRS